MTGTSLGLADFTPSGISAWAPWRPCKLLDPVCRDVGACQLFSFSWLPRPLLPPNCLCPSMILEMKIGRSKWNQEVKFKDATKVKNVPLVSLILLKRSLVFPILLFSSISLYWQPRKLSYLSLLFFGTLHSNGFIFPFLLCLSLLFFFSAICKVSSETILPFCISFSWRWSWSLPPVQCHEPPSTVLQALYLLDLIPWICLSLPLYNCKVFDLVIPEWFSGFPYFL